MATIKGVIAPSIFGVGDGTPRVRRNLSQIDSVLEPIHPLRVQRTTRIIKGNVLMGGGGAVVQERPKQPRQSPLEIPWKKAIFDSSN